VGECPANGELSMSRASLLACEEIVGFCDCEEYTSVEDVKWSSCFLVASCPLSAAETMDATGQDASRVLRQLANVPSNWRTYCSR
jgi:hypothetical protein